MLSQTLPFLYAIYFLTDDPPLYVQSAVEPIHITPLQSKHSLIRNPNEMQIKATVRIGIARLPRSYRPLRHPIRPGLIPTAITAGASRVTSGPRCLHAVANTPAGPMEPVRSELSHQLR